MAYSLDQQPFPVHPRWGTPNHPQFKNQTGKRFGRLIATHYCGAQTSDSGKRQYAIWACKCDCGNVTAVWSHSLSSGHTLSCGCWLREATSLATSAHLEGETFGRLTVIERIAGYTGNVRWLCLCECGGEKVAITDNLRAGKTRSCGCLQRENVSAINTTHGKSGSPEHFVWKGMRARCLNPRNPSFQSYGGRGITICARWLESFEHFLADMGPRPSLNHSIDRMDNDGNYEPTNCHWATASEQASNRRAHTYGREHGADGRFLKSAGDAA